MFPFPDGNACARRVLGIAQSLAAGGRRVVVGAGELPWSEPRLLGVSDGSPGHVQVAGTGEYGKSWPAWRKLRHLVWDGGKATLAWLDAQQTTPEAVIVYGTSEPFLRRLLPWCRRNHVKVIADVVEWYDGGHVLGGRFGPVHLANEYAMRVLACRCDGIIGISRFLCDYYTNRGCRVVRVPPTLDARAVAVGPGGGAGEGRIRLVYAGIPGKKDLIQSVILALAAVDPKGDRFELHLLGPTEAQLHALCPDYSRAAVHAQGRRTHSKVVEAVREADFSVLIRPNERYANAGFPTKVVESLCCGTPVICNLTSDLGEHIRHGTTGMVCHDHSVPSFAASLREVSAMAPAQLQAMRGAAYAHAQDAFDYRAHIAAMARFVSDVLEDAA